MYYTRIHIQNYKSFLNTGEIKISKGINLIIGQNNVGKTALLELLSGSVNFRPHLNKELKPRKESKISDDSSQNSLDIAISPQELSYLVEDYSKGDYIFLNKLIPYSSIGYVKRIEPYDYNDPESDTYEIDELVTFNGVDYSNTKELENYLIEIVDNYLTINYLISSKESTIVNVYSENVRTSGNIEGLIYKANKQLDLRQISNEYEISKIITKEFFENRVYKFDVHRTIYSGKIGINTNKLESNCTNLPSVLDSLQANPNKLKEYQELVAEVFPKIKNVSINKLSESAIRIWMPQSDNRPDLTIPLEDCGTGIGQVLAMLYVIVSSEEPKVIIIDEPNSFLHPSASRKLVEIFKKYNQHQYIISTHSPELITAADADQILLLTLNEQGQTQVREIDKTISNGMRDILENIGSKLSDVFGYESILWVEGSTEENCFPIIIKKLLGKSLNQRAILEVKNTGDFDKKHIETTFDLYERLVKGNALIPPATAFIFDKEDRKPELIQKLEEAGTIEMEGEKIKKIYFLKRRMYENYILNVSAIVAIINKYSLELGWDRQFENNEIESYFNDNKIKREYYWKHRPPTQEEILNWRININAGKLLEDLVKDFGETRFRYKKRTFSQELTEWIIENAPHELDELKELLSKFYE